MSLLGHPAVPLDSVAVNTEPSESAGPPRTARRWARRATALIALAVVLSGCNQSWRFENNPGATKQGQYTYRMFQGFDITALAVGAVVWALIFWCVLRYRRKHADEMPKQTRYNVPWEVVYTLTPILMVAGLFAITVKGENYVDRVAAHPDQRLAVTGFQWGWKFDYDLGNGQHAVVVSDPSHFATIELPKGEETRVTLRSADVVHSFFVPAFNFQRYAQPGITNVFDFTPTDLGTYTGRCNYLCGLHHDLMIFHVKVVPQSEFNTWVQQQATPKAAA